jgi:hypothetical protein
MLYKYDKTQLIYKKVKYGELILKSMLITICLILILGVKSKINGEKIEQLSFEERLVVINEYNEFSEEKLISKLKELNFRFPHIVLAQSKIETGHFKSKMFNENNNLFGMKQAKTRINTAGGTQHGHAYYDTWTESVYDYALYSSTYLHKIKNESQYYSYLSQNYATDPGYVSKLKNIIEKENLKTKF